MKIIKRERILAVFFGGSPEGEGTGRQIYPPNEAQAEQT